jgi:hypothetical protein
MPSEGNTVEVYQVWVTADGEVLKVTNRRNYGAEYVGKPHAEVVPQLEADGWHEIGRFVASDVPGAVRIAYHRSKNSP